MKKLLVILGPTATGKTRLAACVAKAVGGEIISADSRQVYRNMDLGTGKDYEDYIVDGVKVPYHLIDILEPGSKYNIFEYQKDFLKVYQDILSREKVPVLCGGSGLYIDAAIKGYDLIPVPPDPELRARLEEQSLEQLTVTLSSLKKLHNKTDVDNKKRAIRAIEIEMFLQKEEAKGIRFPEIESVIVGVGSDREYRRQRISARLKQRLDNGLIDEVKTLLSQGISSEDLIYYGLEYKYVTEHVLGYFGREELFSKLETAIHQFAKRQMTYFRGMERKGTVIHWIDSGLSEKEKTDKIIELWKESV